MTVFSDRLSTGIDVLYERAGDEAVFVDNRGRKHDCTVVIDYALDSYGQVANISAGTAVVCVRVSEIDHPPSRGEFFRLTETRAELTVDQVLESNKFEHRCLTS